MAEDLAPPFARLAAAGVDGVVKPNAFLYGSERAQIIALAAMHGLPTIGAPRATTEQGGLMSYGCGLGSYAIAAAQVVRILEGARPADVPFETARCELGINLKTANEQGVDLSPNIIALADFVIE